MSITRVELENYRCYKSFSQDFTNELNIIAAPNGTGKTSIVEAVSFALFGNKLTRGKANSWVRKGCKHGKVKLFIDNFIITRGDNEQHVTDSTKTIIARQHVGVDEWIMKKYGLNADLYSTSNYIAQKDIESFSGLQAAEKIKRIEKLLRIDVLDTIRAKAKENEKVLFPENKVFKSKLTNKTVSSSAIAESKKEIKKLNSKIEKFETEYEKAINTNAEYKSQLEKWEIKKELISKTKNIIYTDIDDSISDLLSMKEAVNAATKAKLELETMNSTIIATDKQKDIISFSEKVIENRKVYEDLLNVTETCPTCGQHIPDATDLIAKRDFANKEYKKYTDLVEQAKLSSRKYKLSNLLYECKYKDIDKVISDLEAKPFLDRLIELESIEKPRKTVDISVIKSKLNESKKKLNTLKIYITEAEKTKDLHDTYESLLKESSKKLSELSRFIEFISAYRKEFTKNIVPLIESNASNLFHFITDNKFSKFSIDENYNIDDYDILSGSESDVASLAIRMAIAQISRIGSFDTIILDEVAASFDENKESLLIELLEKTKKQIIYISHGNI
tara:strand:- start:3751 stop:5436 length:1686 start_codon:yes stop_codon:yes gene_type:complete